MNRKENSAMFEQAQPQAVRTAYYNGPGNAPMPPPQPQPSRETVLIVIDQVVGHQHAAHELVGRIESAIGIPGEPPSGGAAAKSAGIAPGALTARSQVISLNERLVRIADALA